jgi:2-octaprenylphenol hydroxylase
MQQNSFDVVIVGAGMVGATLACALGGSRLRVGVLEAALPGEVDPRVWDLRVSSISRASEAIYRNLGAWEGMLARRVSPFREMVVWEDGGLVHFDAAELGEPHLGHIVENRVMQAALLERLAAHDNLALLTPVGLAALDLDPSRARLTLEDGRVLETALVVGADGAGSRVRGLAGIPVTTRDYGQKGLVATVRNERPSAETARQRFLPGGPLAFLPLRDGRSSIVWSLPTEQADGLLAVDDAAFAARLGAAFGDALGAVLEVGSRAAFPLVRRHALAYVRERLALVGDAAHTIHPLAGQGVNLGLLDAASLAEVVLAARSKGRDLGSLHVLRRYERWRRGDNTLMQGAMDGFHLLFAQPRGPLTALRRWGLAGTDRLGPAKHLFMRHAMGRRGDLPRLAKG